MLGCEEKLNIFVGRTFVAPLERLKLEYIVRGEQKNLYELVKMIAVSQGLRGFWKGNLVNILRTAPFKAVNFCAYDTYRKQLLIFSGNEETTNFERFIAGAAAGITATVLCLPLDTVREIGNFAIGFFFFFLELQLGITFTIEVFLSKLSFCVCFLCCA